MTKPVLARLGARAFISPDGSGAIPPAAWPLAAAWTLLDLPLAKEQLEARLGVRPVHRAYVEGGEDAAAALIRQQHERLGQARDTFSQPVDERPWPGEFPATLGHALTHYDEDTSPDEPGAHRLADVRPGDELLAWYLARAATRQETRAEKNLVEAGFAVYVPRSARWADRLRRGAQRRRVESSLFGGYLFVGLGPKRTIGEVEEVEAVHAVVRFAAECAPRRLPFEAIRALLQEELDGEYDKTRRNRNKDPKPGTAVRVTHGIFSGWPAKFIERREDERIALMLTMFGRETPYIADPEDVELPEVKEARP